MRYLHTLLKIFMMSFFILTSSCASFTSIENSTSTHNKYTLFEVTSILKTKEKTKVIVISKSLYTTQTYVFKSDMGVYEVGDIIRVNGNSIDN